MRKLGLKPPDALCGLPAGSEGLRASRGECGNRLKLSLSFSFSVCHWAGAQPLRPLVSLSFVNEENDTQLLKWT